VHKCETDLIADRVIAPDLVHVKLILFAQAPRDVDHASWYVQMKRRAQLAEVRPLRERLQMVDRLARFNLDHSLKPVSAFLRREDHVRIYRRNARPDGRVLFVSGIDAHVVLATPFRLKQADYAVVLELLAHRPHQDWAQRRLPTIEKRKETTKFNMEASREAAAARTRLQYGDAATMTEPTTGTILIVDDDEGVTTTFARMLRLEGYHVHTALNAEMGLREAQTSRPDAIILDLRMPLVDGLGFLRRLRAHEDQRDTPVAIVTGDYFLDDTVSNELRALGAELRFKPMWLEDLVGLARTLLKVTTDRRGDSIH
jgi:CheY-like chemotaxis protein